MTDHLDTIRATAQAEAEQRGSAAVSLGGYRNEGKEDAFVRGAVWLASRLTREKVAEAIDDIIGGIDLNDTTRSEMDAAVMEAADAVLALLGTSIREVDSGSN